MSTKVGIAYDEEYYLYQECFDNNDFVYLRVESSETSVRNYNGKSETTLRVGIKTWRKIVDGWINSDWGKHPEWDEKNDVEYDEEGLLKFLEELERK